MAPAANISEYVGIGLAAFLICIIGSPKLDLPQNYMLTKSSSLLTRDIWESVNR